MKNKVKERKGTSYLGILIALLALCVVLSFASSSFLTVSNLLNVSQQISTNFLIAIGMTFIILLGGIDLSVGSIIAVTGLMMGLMMKSWNLPVLVSILLGLVFASAIGMATGLLITGFELPPFIATLGMMSIARGAAYTITQGQPIYTFPEGFLAITGRYGGVPIFTILIMAVLFLIAAYVLKYTKYGRYIYAIGGNENCARLSGINVKKVKCLAYVISGFCCGVAAIILTSRLDSAVPTNADGAELDAIAAVVIHERRRGDAGRDADRNPDHRDRGKWSEPAERAPGRAAYGKGRNHCAGSDCGCDPQKKKPKSLSGGNKRTEKRYNDWRKNDE
jgi:ribose transport system permease protein